MTYGYDALNRPVNISYGPAAPQTPPAASSSATFAYSYDATNRRIGQTTTDREWWSSPSQPASIAYSANALNQYAKVGSASPTYDRNGALTFDGQFTSCYDTESRLISVLSAGTCASPTTALASYAYDAQGRRKSRTVAGATTTFITDADNREVVEYTSSGAVQTWYAFDLGPDAVVSQMNVASGTRATLIPDVLGSVAASLDSSGMLTKFGYQTFGENPTLTTPGLRYVARRLDPETGGSTTAQPSGLYYFRARTYSPTWGRFLQPDPVGYSAGPNLYAYVDNDPLNNVDPSGLATLQLGISGSIGLPFGASFPLGFGIAVDNFGHVGLYGFAGLVGQLGASVDAGFSIQVSDAMTISDLRGRFDNYSIHGGAALGAAVDLFSGSSPHGPVSGSGITFGSTTGASVSGGATYTLLYAPFGSGDSPTDVPIAPPEQISTLPPPVSTVTAPNLSHFISAGALSSIPSK